MIIIYGLRIHLKIRKEWVDLLTLKSSVLIKKSREFCYNSHFVFSLDQALSDKTARGSEFIGDSRKRARSNSPSLPDAKRRRYDQEDDDDIEGDDYRLWNVEAFKNFTTNPNYNSEVYGII